MNLNYYPSNSAAPYYIEFTHGFRLVWTLYQRNFQDFAKNDFNPTGELHPYSLGCGTVEENSVLICMNTEKFLKFMVDALNEKAQKDEWEKINIY